MALVSTDYGSDSNNEEQVNDNNNKKIITPDDNDNNNNNNDNNDDNKNKNNNNNNTDSLQLMTIDAAPNVDTTMMTIGKEMQKYTDPHLKEIMYNPKAEYLFAPIQGPLPKGVMSREEAFCNPSTTLAGHVEFHKMDHFIFDEQYHTYQNFGYAIDPSKGISTNPNDDSNFVGNKQLLLENQSMTVFNQSNEMMKTKKDSKRKRMKRGDPGDVQGYLGSWAPNVFTKEEEEKFTKELEVRKQEWSLTHNNNEKRKKRKLNNNNNNNDNNNDNKDDANNTVTKDDENDIGEDDIEENDEENIEKLKAKRAKQCEEQAKIESTEFTGTALQDYLGRSYLHCPTELRRQYIVDLKYYIPKKCVHNFVGHKNGINGISFFPKTGHLLLSCANDNLVKIWDVYNDRKCLRTYSGHSLGVRNICFSRDGTRFLTTSYDKWIKLWDTESGKVIWRGTSGKLVFNATLYPENENNFIVGQKNKIAVQWDMRSNRITQRYDEHLSAVNTITFIDNNRRFVTTSDDKKIFIWDYGIPVVIKHIAEPNLHSVPYVTVHPNGKWFLGQSMDNQIVVYSTGNRFRQNMKKHFTGHLSAGYACQIDVSYDGKLVMSGDAQGRLFFWDWNTSKHFGKLKCHSQVTTGCIWHPVQTSLVATCSWDGMIKLWE